MFSVPRRFENIREIPYPYKGLVAISNDAEYTSCDFLDWLLVFLNSDQITPLGRGLGLEFASSLFFYSKTPLHASVFDSLSAHAQETKDASKIREYIKMGYVDTNHAYGDFNVQENFTREHALRVHEMLDKHALQIPIYTNHGNGSVQSMQHNVGFLPYHGGSKPDSPFYHTDIFKKHGGTYIWTDDWVHERKAAVSLEGKVTYLEDGRQPGGNELIQKMFCGDGEYFFFKRYRSTGMIAPTFQTFNHQISSIDWKDFYAHARAMVFYQHFGTFYVSHKGNVPTTLDLLRQFPYYLNGFYFLKQEQDRGNLLIMKTSRLLRYIEMYLSTKAESVKTEHAETITLRNYSPERMKELEFFDGLTIYIENPKKEIKVFCGDKRCKFVYNGIDERSLYSITIDSQKGEI